MFAPRSADPTMGPWHERLVRAKAHLEAPWFKRSRRGTFALGGRTYDYFLHGYNGTWRNERMVEVPPALELARARAAGRVVEIGNVLSFYGAPAHEIVDYYERAPGVRNEDVMTFEPSGPYDAVIAISTLEHVGVDEPQRDRTKARAAIERLGGLLGPGGELLVTIPLGWNPDLDEGLADGSLAFDETAFLRRTSPKGDWREIGADEAAGAPYGEPFPFANVVAFGRRTAPDGAPA